LWGDFGRIMMQARSEGKAGEDAEKAFQDARAECARQGAAMFDWLEISPDGAHEILEVLKIGSLGSVVSSPEMQWRKIEEARGRAEVGLQGLLGVLQGRYQCIARLDVAGIVARRMLFSWPMKLLYLTVGIVIIFLVLSAVVR
jgi:hypothetical protein